MYIITTFVKVKLYAAFPKLDFRFKNIAGETLDSATVNRLLTDLE